MAGRSSINLYHAPSGSDDDDNYLDPLSDDGDDGGAFKGAHERDFERFFRPEPGNLEEELARAGIADDPDTTFSFDTEPPRSDDAPVLAPTNSVAAPFSSGDEKQEHTERQGAFVDAIHTKLEEMMHEASGRLEQSIHDNYDELDDELLEQVKISEQRAAKFESELEIEKARTQRSRKRAAKFKRDLEKCTSMVNKWPTPSESLEPLQFEA